MNPEVDWFFEKETKWQTTHLLRPERGSFHLTDNRRASGQITYLHRLPVQALERSFQIPAHAGMHPGGLHHRAPGSSEPPETGGFIKPANGDKRKWRR